MMNKMICLKLTKKEALQLVEDCLSLKDGDELYYGYSNDECSKAVCELYKSIHNKLILCLYGKELNGKSCVEK